MPGLKSRRARKPKLGGKVGVDYVRCRICGDHRRVITGRHLSKHQIDRQTYLAEYRLSPDELIAKDTRRRQSSRPYYHAFDRREWIAAIRRFYEKTGNVFAVTVQKQSPHLYSQALWIFGNWNSALRAARFQPERVRQHNLWNPDKVIKRIGQLRKQRQPLFACYAMTNHQDLFAGATRYFGTWSKALRAAGLPTEKRPGVSRLGLLRALRDIRESESKEIPEPLKLQAEQYFGSVRKAMAELKTNRKVINGWSKPKIIAILTHMHRKKEGLRYGQLRRENQALVSAAEAYFGSWGKALHAAGINPNIYLVHPQWSKQRLQLTRFRNADNRS